MVGEVVDPGSGDEPFSDAAADAPHAPEEREAAAPNGAEAPGYTVIGRLEVVFGVVYGAGVEAGPFEELLRSQLRDFGYRLEIIHLSDTFPMVLGEEFSEDSENATRRLQDMGDALRRRAGLSIIGRLAVLLIAQQRRALRTNAPERVAWLVRSLRRSEEVRFLRKVYGPRFILLGIHVPESQRLENLVERRRAVSPTTSGPFDVAAVEDIRRDEEDLTKSYGQAMRKAMAEADFVIDARSNKKLDTALARTVEVIFGNPFVTPTREEQAMYQAYAAGLRSAEMGRQVGAAIIRQDGTLISVGTNEVPSGGGGLYWHPDDPDARDFAQSVPVDANTEWKRRVAREVLKRLSDPPGLEQVASDELDDESDPQAARRDEAEDSTGQWLADPRIRVLSNEVIVEEKALQAFLRLMRGTRFDDLTEFGRAVHAEMDAVLNAARTGVSISGATLVCTTFPCHTCVRHLIAVGIRRVQYLYPYVKSLGRELHADALVVDPVEMDRVPSNRLILEQFVGVTPRGFAQYFDFRRISRKYDKTGRANRLTDRRNAEPRVTRSFDTWSFDGPALDVVLLSDIERQAAARTAEHLKKNGLNLPEVKT